MTWKTEPAPGRLLTESSPPISAVSILAMVSPRPAPGTAAAALPPRAKGSKICSISSGLRPGPVSSMSSQAISRA